MPELEDDMLDGLLRQHLSAELDGQLGRSEFAFRQHLAQPAPARPEPLRPSIWHGGRIFAIVGTALAASVAGLFAAPFVFHGHATTPSAGSIDRGTQNAQAVKAPSESSPMMRFVHSRAYDEGTVIVGGSTPARKVRRVELDRSQWSDDQGHWELTVPHEDVQYDELDTY